MRDPHVASLDYRLEPAEKITFARQAASVEAESDGSKVRLAGDSLVVEMLARRFKRRPWAPPWILAAGVRRGVEGDTVKVGWRTIGILAAFAIVGGCGTSEPDDPGPPVGQAVRPDLVPAPPRDVHTRHKEGRWSLTFSSILVNVGDGEFVLRATRDGAGWRVQQQISYSESGADRVAIDTPLVWGGDGHEHWHVPRVATNRLVARGGRGALKGERARIDSKVGFCFFDFSRRLDKGPTEKVHSRESCGKRDDEEISMGLSPGWGDTYEWVLPGQSIDLTGVPDGKYRLWAEADERRRFREVTSDNNMTWIDFRLSTVTGGARTALVMHVGPEPR